MIVFLSVLTILVGFALLILAMAKGYITPGCSGDCYQGRRPCNCKVQDE